MINRASFERYCSTLMILPGLLSISATMIPRAAIAATIRIDTSIDAPLAEVWAAIRDVGAVSTRLAPGFVIDVRMEGGDRIVTFANGAVVRETIVSIDEGNHRLGYAASGGVAKFHFASIEVVPEVSGCRLIWTTDVLPDAAAIRVRVLMEQGAAVMKKTLEDAALTLRLRDEH